MERISGIFNLSNADLSTTRHSSYPLLAMQSLGSFKHVINWLFGIGPRTSGLALVNSVGVGGVYNFNTNSIWAVECDFAELLLGYGIIGLLLYYYVLIAFFRNKKYECKMFGLAMLVMSFMYDYSSLTLTMITIIFVTAMSERKYCCNEKLGNYFDKLQATGNDEMLHRLN